MLHFFSVRKRFEKKQNPALAAGFFYSADLVSGIFFFDLPKKTGFLYKRSLKSSMGNAEKF